MMTSPLISLLVWLPQLFAKPVVDVTAKEPSDMLGETTPHPSSRTDTALFEFLRLSTVNSPPETQEILTTSVLNRVENDNRGHRQSTQMQMSPSVKPELGGDVITSEITTVGQQTEDTPQEINTTPFSFSLSHLIGRNRSSLNSTLDDNTSPECKEDDRGHSSKLVCFIALLVLGATASLFLGITICMCARLSAQKERVRRRGTKEQDEVTGVELKDLWTAQKSSLEERVEFWYASGTTVGRDGQGRSERTADRREWRRERMEGDCLSTQPKVTLEDINDFWYLNGRTLKETIL